MFHGWKFFKGWGLVVGEDELMDVDVDVLLQQHNAHKNIFN
jgi:hypothetical protein